jgi:spore maturation protein CgeB
MRWVVAQPGPSWSVQDVHVGWCEALREHGEHVVEFNLDDRLAFYSHALLDVGEPGPDGALTLRKALTGDQAAELAVNGLAAALWKVRPDVLLVVSGFFTPPEMLDQARRYGTRVVVLHTEEPYEVERELELAQHADLNLLNDPTHLARFEAVAPSVYAPHAYRPAVHHPGAPDPDLICDLGFVGTGFGSRRWFLERMDLAGLDVLLAGNWEGIDEDSPLRPFVAAESPGHCLDNARAADVYRSARCGINLYRREAEHDTVCGGWAMGPREVEMAACGLFYLRDPRPEGDQVLAMLPTFADPGEASELLRWWLAHPDERAAMAAQAREAIADRTFHNHAAHLLRLLDRQPVTA